MRWRREDFCPVSQAPERICRRLSRFCNILLQDVTPVHVKITSSTSLLSVCQKKYKLSTYLHIVSYNHISFLTRRYQLGSVLALSSQWRIQGRGPGGRPNPPPPPPPPPPPLLFLDQTEARRAENSFLRDPPPTPFSQGLDPAVVLDSIR